MLSTINTKISIELYNKQTNTIYFTSITVIYTRGRECLQQSNFVALTSTYECVVPKDVMFLRLLNIVRYAQTLYNQHILSKVSFFSYTDISCRNKMKIVKAYHNIGSAFVHGY
jgi:hypothetical protein